MRAWDGSLFDVLWAGVEDSAPSIDILTPFVSQFADPDWPFDLGLPGEVPMIFQGRSKAVVPGDICINCRIGPDGYWMVNWPPTAPKVILGPDGWPLGCEDRWQLDSCISQCSEASFEGGSESEVETCIAQCSAFTVTTPPVLQLDSCICEASSVAPSVGGQAQVASCIAECSRAGYTTGGTFSIASCAAQCSEVTGIETGAEFAASSCIAQCSSTEYLTPMPIVTYGCATPAAAGTTSGTATLLGSDINSISNGNGFNGVRLPSGCYRVLIINDTGGMPPTTFNLYPPTGEKFQGHAPDGPISMNAGTITECFRDPNGVWHYNGNWT